MNSDGKSSYLGLSPLEFYKNVYDNLPQAIIVVKDDVVFYANRAFANLIEYPLKEILDWSTEQLFNFLLTHQDELKSLYEMGGSPDVDGIVYPYEIMTRNGKIKHIEMIPVRFVLHGNEFYHAMLLDVSERVKAIKDMKESEERFRQTFDSIPDPAYLWEQDDKKCIKLKMANKRVVEMSRGLVNQHLGKDSNSLFPDNPEFFEYIHFTMETGQNIRTEIAMTHPQSQRIVTIIVHCVRPAENLVLMITTDITKEREAQEIAQRSEKEKSVILDSMRDHLIYYETDDLVISWANRAAGDSLGLRPADLVGKQCFKLWHNISEPCTSCPIVAAWRSGNIQTSEMATPDGRLWLVKGLPIKNMAEKVIGVVEVTREITAEKEAERITQEAKDRAELYLDLLSHDLNNIHQGVIIGLQLALQEKTLPKELSRILQTSLEQINRSVNLIRNVQRFSTILDSPAELVQMELVPVVESAIQLVKNSFPQRELVIHLDTLEDNAIITADEFLIDAIFNLLHNAVKHDTKEKVTLDIRIEKTEDSKYIAFHLYDRGPGIDDESKKFLLDRISSSLKIGTGMGLTLVKRIINRYNGGVVIRDRVAGDHTKGACFTLLFPINED